MLRGIFGSRRRAPCVVLSLEDDVVASIILFLTGSASEALQAGLVCSKWQDVIRHGSTLWGSLAAARWPSVRPGPRISDWLGYYRRRHEQGRRLRPYRQLTPINNCSFTFRCPMYKEMLTPVAGSDDLSCSACKRTVRRVRTQRELEDRTAEDECVWFDVEDVGVPLKRMLTGGTVELRCCLLGPAGCGKSHFVLSAMAAAAAQGSDAASVSETPGTDPWAVFQMLQSGSRKAIFPDLTKISFAEAETVAEFESMAQRCSFHLVAVCYDATDSSSLEAAARMLPSAMEHAGRRRGVATLGLRCDQRPRGLRSLMSSGASLKDAQQAVQRIVTELRESRPPPWASPAPTDEEAVPFAGPAAGEHVKRPVEAWNSPRGFQIPPPAGPFGVAPSYQFFSNKKMDGGAPFPEVTALLAAMLTPVLPAQRRHMGGGCTVL